MIKKYIIISLLPLFTSCVTLSKGAKSVEVYSQGEQVEQICNKLGPVHADYTFCDLSTERLNIMKKESYKKGGNALVVLSDSIGLAYSCR